MAVRGLSVEHRREHVLAYLEIPHRNQPHLRSGSGELSCMKEPSRRGWCLPRRLAYYATAVASSSTISSGYASRATPMSDPGGAAPAAPSRSAITA